ncbi:hypothetical protein SARC_10522 [Sphaeroforma arctica JP610]|uniref:Exoribonuclease phosphorolytic domain-containing protein n=1 Tax=Sphaeroforma arctica JP610 TaxID=667725 RepID=A0A0L0FJP5_9EUKA|nr:hypothetical protein SARC_10522 [Sphaeroforma arctica JP610]KNC77002.1 hypothetical protein SARC_10522 [Sphaeroforma arctica JP610]|eukprot:XP_014150904.1 hypothetical protein SARC_10522 [Sphaeroforma arctica JP610]
MSQASSIGTQFQTSNEKTNTLHQFISDIFQRGKYLPLDQLCVVEGEIAWTLYAEINILEFDGGLETASLLALVAALQNVLLPAYEADTEAGEMVPTEADATKLDMTGVPFALGFSLFDDSLVTDLTMEEEVLMDSRVCVVVDSSENIVRVDKIGGRPLSSDRLRSVVHTTKRNLNGVLETLAAA